MAVRILHVVGDSKLGGASLGIIRLARFWQTLDWEVAVLATDPQFCGAAAAAGVPVIPADVIWREIRPWADLKGLWKLYRFLRSHRYTVVHTHTTKAGFVGRIAARMANVPVVIHTVHGLAFHESSPRVKILFYTVLERIASWGCQKVIAVSHFHEQWGKQLGIAAREKIRAIPNGIPDSRNSVCEDRQRVRDRWNIKEGQTVLLTPGRLAPEKGLEDLLNALGQLSPEPRQRLALLIVGEGELRLNLERMAEDAGLREQVCFTGFQEDIPELLAASDIVVFPTWREGLSIALLEAMCQGCAIITTAIGSNREATNEGEGALLVAPKQPAQLAAAITKLVDDEALRSQLGMSARRIYEQRYTQERMLAGYHGLYLESLKELSSAQTISPVLSSADR
ncbi:MAG: glycosyltransferase family 4 protein [Bryobacterales bacterium]|nr:glycosyltransferase family 4 protein [Bryobacterales bacterium]